MRIGRVAKLSGLTVKAIRFYEETGLLGEVSRRASYRDFTAADVDRLKLITHCRGLGFSVADIQEIIGLLESSEGACPDAAAMLHVVRTRRRSVAADLKLLGDQHEQLLSTERYLELRVEGRA
jgi:DNA-binding transcriptional MerR regulator